MKIRVLGGGWYGSSITMGLLADGHDVVLHEIAEQLFTGASGGNPARLHLGFHYPRSGMTQAACQEHYAAFMLKYGHLTRGVPINLYAVAADDSLVDFRSYCDTLRGRVEFIRVHPDEYGLQNVEGAVLTGERHIVIDKARAWFTEELKGHVRFAMAPGSVDDPQWDMTIDCSFCANDSENIDRFEPCVMALLQGPADTAVTIMDGQFGSLFPWNEDKHLSSLTSAKFTPISKPVAMPCSIRWRTTGLHVRTAIASWTIGAPSAPCRAPLPIAGWLMWCGSGNVPCACARGR